MNQPAPEHIPPVVNGQPTATAVSSNNPGQATGIIGLVLAFGGLALFGLVLSIISTVQSRKAKASALLGVLGIIFNGIAVLTISFLIAVFLIVFNSYDYTKLAQNEGVDYTTTYSDAHTVMRRASSYNSFYGKFPQSITDFEVQKETSLSTLTTKITPELPTDETSIQYKACGKTGAKVSYIATIDKPITIKYLGDGTADSCLDTQTEA